MRVFFGFAFGVVLAVNRRPLLELILPVVSHSQKRKKWLTSGCRSSARDAPDAESEKW